MDIKKKKAMCYKKYYSGCSEIDHLQPANISHLVTMEKYTDEMFQWVPFNFPSVA